MKDYYNILGIPINASSEEIKKAYRLLAKKYHPDVNKENTEFYEEKFKEVSEAYEILNDEERRLKYNKELESYKSRSSNNYSDYNNYNANNTSYNNYSRNNEDSSTSYSDKNNSNYEADSKSNSYNNKNSKNDFSEKDNNKVKPRKKKSFIKKVAILVGIVLAFNFVFKNYKEKKAESTLSENITTYSSYRDLNDHAKKNANAFIEVLNKHNIEHSTIPSGMVVVNTHNIYEKYTNEYMYETVYEMIPNFDKGIGYECFYVYYQYPLEQKIKEDYISIFVDAVNALTEEEISLEQIKEEMSKEKFALYKPINIGAIEIKQISDTEIKLKYEREFNTNIASKPNYTIENDMITGPKIKNYDTVQEYLDSIKLLNEDFKNKYGEDFTSFSYEISDGIIEEGKEVKAQFSQNLLIRINESILNDIDDVELNTIINIIEDFCGSEIIDKDLMIEFIKSHTVNTEFKINSLFVEKEDFTPHYTLHMGGDIDIKLQNYRYVTTNFIDIDIKIPVIAEGIGYVNLY